MTDSLEKLLLKEDSPCEDNRLVFRLRTTAYESSGYTLSKCLIPMRRLSKGHDFFAEDVSHVGVKECMDWIVNLDECEDGLYRLIMINEKRDWESGCVEEWDYKLVPYEVEDGRVKV